MEARLERIKQRLFQEYYKKKDWWGDDLSIFDDDPGLVSRPLVVRKALAVQKVCREMPIEVKDDELQLLLTVHDECDFSCTGPRVAEHKAMIKRILETFDGEQCPIKFNILSTPAVVLPYPAGPEKNKRRRSGASRTAIC